MDRGDRLAWLWGFLLLAASTAVTGGAELKPQLGPVEEGVLLDDFTMESQAAWKPSAGSNVGYRLETGRNIPGVASSLMQIELSRKDPTDSAPGHNWFSMKRSLPASGRMSLRQSPEISNTSAVPMRASSSSRVRTSKLLRPVFRMSNRAWN